MAQVKVYGLREHLDAPTKARMSGEIHACAVEALGLPERKRFHRFFALEKEDFFYPESRSERYTILESSMFEGRSEGAKKALVRLLYKRFGENLGIGPEDLKVTIIESPRANWGIRGLPADEIGLDYTVEV
ncbi:Tautomerase enzyme [Rubrobacter radiotolerans]|uniref:Tautomerase enzyme n=1 Tax=Rubrobacter radiotolerans TaxID=42256 RepID=A0A023X4L8_RUBRA|nr:tautomerase family protein [Rubrobacter radiotolerans]AHY46945.1 Tautomerase enzyme [Rubrobacter radiotolerans]MDX5894350.1 tautomerase family protein [Rubrobacter radiotolerans]SMC05799.1 Phenylpyruvate tautomerase PptA, 4-oxalocrotonate tautomerase family [Rubrobacter radiotolerans DSM 5868]